MIKNLFKDFFFPKTCTICSRPNRLICTSCIKKLERAHLKCLKCGKKNPYGCYCKDCAHDKKPQQVFALFKYDGLAKELIHEMKYKDCHELASVLGQYLAKNFKTNLTGYTVTFVPVHKSKQRYRGYNQAQIIARAFACELNLDCQECLVRFRRTDSQVDKESHQERRKNIKNSIEAKKKNPERIVLVDDVVTSGATVEECARVLYKSGTKNIIAVSLAIG